MTHVFIKKIAFTSRLVKVTNSYNNNMTFVQCNFTQVIKTYIFKKNICWLSEPSKPSKK